MPLDSAVEKGLWPIADDAAVGSAIFDGPVTWPLLTLNVPAVSHNVATLAGFCSRHGLELAPHGKTTMMPDVFRLQLEAGAWGITVASAHQASVCRRAGIGHILLANEVLDERALRWLVEEHRADPACQLLLYADSVPGARLLADVATAAAPGRALSVLIEIGYPGGRAGCRTVEQTLSVAGELQKCAYLTVEGIAAYEGSLEFDEVEPFFDRMKEHLRALHDASVFATDRPVTVTVGGSKYFDLVARSWGREWSPSYPRRVILRSGSYVTHDDLYYERLTPFRRIPEEGSLRSALTLWAQVLSTPEPGLAICGFGMRDASNDQGNPVPRLLHRDGATEVAARHQVRKLNDQHAFVEVDPAQPLLVGDVVGFGISHPCTTIDRWRRVVTVDPDHRVLAIWPTYF
jgi:D-serine deaminase-like pyridoxal phosphate-dependent protein